MIEWLPTCLTKTLAVAKMCGIAGFFNKQINSSDREHMSRGMAEALRHRGPDGMGIWHSDAGLSLIHTRLAIIDTSPLGKQPMLSSKSKWVVTFNGEIYNYKDLRNDLIDKGYSFKGHSDTEVLVNLLEFYGMEKTMSMISGMYAIAAYDIESQNLYLIRDRLGEKPLYYYSSPDSIIFGSELKAFHKLPFWKKNISEKSLALYFKYNYIPKPHSIFENTFKVPQGNYVVFNLKNTSQAKTVEYWSPQVKKFNLENKSEGELISELESTLLRVIKQEMVADVPLGSFLSGGIDSTLITAMMQAQSPIPIKSFTIGFENQNFDESRHAKKVATHLGCQHMEWILSEKYATDVIPSICEIYDEPFSDSSQLPTYLLSKMTRSQVTVSLSGDGGDELFGGYTRYQWAEKSWKINKYTPNFLKSITKSIISSVKEENWNTTYNYLKFLFPKKSQVTHMGSKLYKLRELLDSQTEVILYDKLLSHLYDPTSILSSKIKLDSTHDRLDGEGFLNYMMRHDAANYLPDDIMVKVDRASMAASLETRAPFLHHEIFEYSNSLPVKYKIKNGSQKYILKKILDKYIPKELTQRPKMGFGIPINSWLKGQLKPWVLDTLGPRELAKHNLLDSAAVAQQLDDYYNKNHNLAHHIWDLIVFQTWYNKWMDN